MTDMPPVLKDAISALKPGEISEPLRQELSPMMYAYSLIRLLEHIPAKRLTLEKDRDKITEIAKDTKFREKLDVYVKGLRQKVYIENKLEKGG